MDVRRILRYCHEHMLHEDYERTDVSVEGMYLFNYPGTTNSELVYVSCIRVYKAIKGYTVFYKIYGTNDDAETDLRYRGDRQGFAFSSSDDENEFVYIKFSEYFKRLVIDEV